MLILVLSVVILKFADFILIPVAWAVFIAFALMPMNKWLETKNIPRPMAIALSIFLVSLFAVLVLYVLLNQMIGLLADVPFISAKLAQSLDELTEFMTKKFGIDMGSNEQGWGASELFSSENLNRTFLSTAKWLTIAGIIPLFTFLFMYYRDFFTEFLYRKFGKRDNPVMDWVKDAGGVIQAYLIGMIKVTGIVALMAGLFFYFFGIKYFLLFAIFIAVMNLIPYIGVLISSLLVILYVFLTFDGIIYPIVTLLVLWGIQLIENNLITPLIVGGKVNINMLAVILAILIGGGIWGISGMVLFIPMVGVLKITLDKSVKWKAYGYLLGDTFPPKKKKAVAEHTT